MANEYSRQAISASGCVPIEPWLSYPNTITYPNTTFSTIYTYPDYGVQRSGDAVNIKVIETMEGFVGQITMMIANKEAIIWESEPKSAAQFAQKATKDKKAVEGTIEANQAAEEDARAHSVEVLRALFEG